MYIKEKERLLHELLEETVQILGLLNKKGYSGLEELFAKRESLIQQITLLDKSQDVNSIDKARELLRPLLIQMMNQESEIQKILVKEKEAVAAQIRKIQLSKKRNTSYNRTPYNVDGYFIDETLKPR